jgi:hypothetical protein
LTIVTAGLGSCAPGPAFAFRLAAQACGARPESDEAGFVAVAKMTSVLHGDDSKSR